MDNKTMPEADLSVPHRSPLCVCLSVCVCVCVVLQWLRNSFCSRFWVRPHSGEASDPQLCKWQRSCHGSFVKPDPLGC